MRTFSFSISIVRWSQQTRPRKATNMEIKTNKTQTGTKHPTLFKLSCSIFDIWRQRHNHKFISHNRPDVWCYCFPSEHIHASSNFANGIVILVSQFNVSHAFNVITQLHQRSSPLDPPTLSQKMLGLGGILSNNVTKRFATGVDWR